MSVRSASSSVGKLKTIYPQFVAVTQAMAIYVSSWTWPSVFTNFTNELSFIFTIRLDVQFPTIPAIAMPVIQIILSGMLLVLAVFLTLHDQKQFYIEALGASHEDVERLTKDYDNLEDEDDDESDSENDEDKLMKVVGKNKNVGNGLVDSAAHKHKKPDDYDYINDAMFDNIGKAFFDESSEEEDNAFEGLAHKIRKRAKFQEIVRNALDMDTKEGRDGDQALNEEEVAKSSGDYVPTRTLGIRPHTRFRLVPKGWNSLKPTDKEKRITARSRIFTFALIRTERREFERAEFIDVVSPFE